AGQRPLLVPSRTEGAAVKGGVADDAWVLVPGGPGIASATNDADYFVIAVRNVGTRIAVIHGWHFFPQGELRPDVQPTQLEDFTRQSRDLYTAPGDVGFWQGALRDPASEDYRAARRAVEDPHRTAVDLLYGDFEGGQRVISRFLLTPRVTENGTLWYASVRRH